MAKTNRRTLDNEMALLQILSSSVDIRGLDVFHGHGEMGESGGGCPGMTD